MVVLTSGMDIRIVEKRKNKVFYLCGLSYGFPEPLVHRKLSLQK